MRLINEDMKKKAEHINQFLAQEQQLEADKQNRALKASASSDDVNSGPPAHNVLEVPHKTLSDS